MIEVYAVLKKDIIQGVFHTDSGMKGVNDSIRNKNIEYDKIVKVNENFEGKKKQSIKEFDKDFNLRPLSERVKDKFVIIPDGFKLVGEEIVKIEVPEEEEIIKTPEEIELENKIKADEKLISEELRKMAIENLGNKLKVVKK